MPKFKVGVKLTDYAYIEVEAENVDEARKKSQQATREDYHVFDGGYCEILEVKPAK